MLGYRKQGNEIQLKMLICLYYNVHLKLRHFRLQQPHKNLDYKKQSFFNKSSVMTQVTMNPSLFEVCS